VPAGSVAAIGLVARAELRTRSLSDRRRQELNLTPEGEAILARAMHAIGAHERHFTSRFTPAELKALVNALGRIHRQRPQQQTFHPAHRNRPEAHRAARHFGGPFPLDRDKAQSRHRRHAFAQTPGGFGKAARAKALRIQRLDTGGLCGSFQTDLPTGRHHIHAISATAQPKKRQGRKKQAYQ